MPVQPTARQNEIFEKLKNYFASKGYKYLGWNGPKDDSYTFGSPETDLVKGKVCCFIQFVSKKPTKHPPESLRVLVMKNKRNKNIKEFEVYKEVFWGKGGRRVFIVPGDQESFQKALRLIDTI